MSSVESQPVPLGGNRVPDSMGGPVCTPWQQLEEQPPQPQGGYGKACDLILLLREEIGNIKKQFSNLAIPIKAYIYNTGAPDRSAVEKDLNAIDAAAAAIGEAAGAAAAAAAEDRYLPQSVIGEATQVLKGLRVDIQKRAADGRALCLVTLDKADTHKQQQQEQQQQEQQQQQQQEEGPGFNKELYGDFNLRLGPVTRSLFSWQKQLLNIIKLIKKERKEEEEEEEHFTN
ncbi:hypothetical protein, conserved [Eimeria maxima]|uniref:Uncharacterized protein n=1 Tax=Eimeria maxima TaxID=5804 RepID=U6MCA1_EIMMA|nr:hypothetical protein, conserved [Eimeria maxima]CDJ61646.1 hypothetical protein, conserved [Eimeria maxima]